MFVANAACTVGQPNFFGAVGFKLQINFLDLKESTRQILGNSEAIEE